MAITAVAASKDFVVQLVVATSVLLSMAITAVAASKEVGEFPIVEDDLHVSMAMTAVAASKVVVQFLIPPISVLCPWRSPPWLHQRIGTPRGHNFFYQVSMAITAVAASGLHPRYTSLACTILNADRDGPWLRKLPPLGSGAPLRPLVGASGRGAGVTNA